MISAIFLSVGLTISSLLLLSSAYWYGRRSGTLFTVLTGTGCVARPLGTAAPTLAVKPAGADSLLACVLMSFQAVCCWLALSDSASLATGCDIEDADPVVAAPLDFDMPAAVA